MSAFSLMSKTQPQITGNKRQLDDDYLKLHKSLPPVNLRAMPQKKIVEICVWSYKTGSNP
jgi:hypothetical protein